MHRDRLDSLRILVTGAGGFIGARLCRALVSAGADVHGVSRRSPVGDDVPARHINLADPGAAQRAVDDVQPDVVFHLASHVTGTRDVAAVWPSLQDNLVSTVNVLTAAHRAGSPRVLLAGSVEEVDVGDRDQVPGSPYAAAKSSSSAYGRMFHALYGLPVVNLRTHMVYGPGQRDGSKLIPYVTRALLRGESPRLSSGAREVDWIYIDDVVDAYLAAAVADGVEGRTIPVGSGELVSVRRVVEGLVELTGGGVEPSFGALPDRPLERARRADRAAAEGLIGWTPSVPLFVGLDRTIQWIRHH